MCYHISFEVKLESITDFFPNLVVDDQTKLDFSSSPHFNGHNHPMVNVIVKSRKDDSWHLTKMLWGFLPTGGVPNYESALKFWNGYKTEEGKYQTGFITLDARGEELLEKRLYAKAARTQRCIILIDGFYEWHHRPKIGAKGQVLKATETYPFYIRFKKNETPFRLVAGIWNPWKHDEIDKETGEVKSFTTPTVSKITTAANEYMARIHNKGKRMPTILNLDLAKEWLSADLSDERITQIASTPYPAEDMDAFPVRKDFKLIDTPQEKFHYPELVPDFC